MKKINLIGFISLFASGLLTAAPHFPCSGFELKIKNNLTEDLRITKFKLKGAEIYPNDIQKLNANSEQIFTINNSVKDIPMTGEFLFHTLSLPSKEVSIQYMLENKGIICQHEDLSLVADYPVEKSSLPDYVNYSINNSPEIFTQ